MHTPPAFDQHAHAAEAMQRTERSAQVDMPFAQRRLHKARAAGDQRGVT